MSPALREVFSFEAGEAQAPAGFPEPLLLKASRGFGANPALGVLQPEAWGSWDRASHAEISCFQECCTSLI
jgi:hypothetical protein